MFLVDSPLLIGKEKWNVIHVDYGYTFQIDNPYHVAYGASAESDGNIYIWNWDNLNGEFQNKTYKFDTFTYEWTQLADYPDSFEFNGRSC